MNVRAIRTTTTVMVVSWQPLTLAEARGFVSHYTVTYSPQIISGGRKRQAAMMEIVQGMDANMTNIDGLDPGTVYNVHVSATTGGGNGVISVVISIPQGISNKLAKRANPRSIKLCTYADIYVQLLG